MATTDLKLEPTGNISKPLFWGRILPLTLGIYACITSLVFGRCVDI